MSSSHDHHAHTGHANCSMEAKAASAGHHAAHDHQAHGGHGGGPIATSFHATLHCLTGCVIGEVLGLAIGVSLGWEPLYAIILATTLAYLSGFTLGVLPVMKTQKLGFWSALRIIWIGEAISIGVMELVMNTVDYQMGGMSAPSVLHWSFWQGFLYAVPAGFIAAWPVNWLLLSRNIKQKCH